MIKNRTDQLNKEAKKAHSVASYDSPPPFFFFFGKYAMCWWSFKNWAKIYEKPAAFTRRFEAS